MNIQIKQVELNYKLYLTEFFSGLAFVRPRTMRSFQLVEQFGDKTSLTKEESLALAIHHNQFSRRLQVNLAGAISALGFIVLGAIVMITGAVAGGNLMYGAGIIIGWIILQVAIAIVLRKSHTTY
jgi:hypothetical protein